MSTMTQFRKESARGQGAPEQLKAAEGAAVLMRNAAAAEASQKDSGPSERPLDGADTAGPTTTSGGTGGTTSGGTGGTTSGGTGGTTTGPAPTPTIGVVVQTGTVPLGQANTFSVQACTPSAPTEYKYEIRRTTASSWLTIAAATGASYAHNERVAGNFAVRAKAKIENNWVTSAAESLTVQFPSITEIIANATVAGWAATAWAATLAATTATSRREEGFWIQYNSTSLSYQKSGACVGTPVANDRTAALDTIQPPAADSPDPAAANAGGATYTIGWYHTHTPTFHRSGGRRTGPSGADGTYANAYTRPGIAHDYTIATAPAGHPLNSAAQMYPCGPTRRPTPA